MRILVFLFLIFTVNSFGQSFTELNQVFIEAGEGGIDWGDLDEDGDLDFVISGLDSKIHINNNGVFSIGQKLSFVENGSLTDNLDEGNVQLSDLNNDGSLDILVSGWTGASEMTRIFINKGDGTFPTSFRLENAGGRFSIAKDLNNDNLLDIIHVDYYSIKVFRNNGSLTFDLIFSNFAPVSDNCFVETGDLDNDGKIDMFLTTKKEFRIYKNKGQFTFSLMDDMGFPFLNDDESISVIDYNKDGFSDLITTGFGGSPFPIYFNKNATLKIDSSNNLIKDVVRGSIDWGDCDNDGDLDLLMTGLRSPQIVTEIYVNENGVFRKSPSVLTGIFYGEAKWGDYDNDGDLDILIWGREQLKIYKNDLINGRFATNSLPSPPSYLSFSQEYDTIVLSWSSGGDNETPPTGLSYNVWVKKEGEFLVSPSADAVNGQSLLSGFGNAFSNKEFRIHGLEVGKTYEWGVQSTDGGFISSHFATSSFTYNEPIVGIEDSQSEIRIYPNPTIGLLNVSHPTSQIIRCTLIDSGGKKLSPFYVSNNLLDLQDIPNGTYILNFVDGGKIKSFMIIKN